MLTLSATSACAQQNAAISMPPAAPTPQVAFTFDDLPAHGPMPPDTTRREIIDSILSTLKKEKLPPVYGFVNGKKIDAEPFQIEVLEDWVKAGEPLGNHTWSHSNLEKESADEFITDIAKGEPVLKRVGRKGNWHWFR